jgi:hypothetical protein
VKRAAVAFRTERRLLAADELRAWLAANRLTLADWNDFLRRAVLRSDTAGPSAAAPGDAATTIWAEGVCSGAFDRFASALAARAAALAANPEVAPRRPPPPEWPDRLWRAEAAYDELVRQVAASDAPRRAVAANSVEWLRVDCEYLASPSEDVAREAALLLREDGLPLPDVARMAGLDPASERMYAGDMDHDLRTRVLSAAPGDLVGPVAIGGSGFLVMAVRDKVAPSMDDPEIRERAEAWALSAAVEREVSGRVSWHEHG